MKWEKQSVGKNCSNSGISIAGVSFKQGIASFDDFIPNDPVR